MSPMKTSPKNKLLNKNWQTRYFYFEILLLVFLLSFQNCQAILRVNGKDTEIDKLQLSGGK
jgi:hypothetical protein